MIRKLTKSFFTISAIMLVANVDSRRPSLHRAATLKPDHDPGRCSALSDQAGLNAFLKELYDPSSPSYRHFLTVPEFTARFGPSQARL
jgi:subtilase family serine protease